MARTKGIALFDDTHGQPNWGQTGFPSRELNSNFSGVADALADLGFDCSAVRSRLLGEVLPRAQLLVLPPPAGYYHPEQECWHSLPSSRLTATEVEAILRFLTDGGRLLAFAYRFGDSFTGANLSDLFTLWEVDAVEAGLPMVGFVERPLQKTGILKARGRPLWTP